MEIRRNVDSSPRARMIAEEYAKDTGENDSSLVLCGCGVDIDVAYYYFCGYCGKDLTPAIMNHE